MDISTILGDFNFIFIAKIFFLILLGIYILFIIMLVNKIRSFDNIINLSGKVGTGFVKSFSVLYLFLLLLLFALTFIIV